MKGIKVKLALVILSASLLCTACGEPFHAVFGTDDLEVYGVSISNDTYGKYEYLVTDGTGYGFRLRTDSRYSIGDKLEIIIKAP